MKLVDYLKETKVELKHVNWPRRRQAAAFTVVVVVVSILTAAFLGVFDTLFQTLLDRFVV
ncbi:MAG: preprotein translocase subunit SecE [Candidatus Taylorbacteria bacterium]|nr:preprotein translocase subunit SecE [Candidatus Taylorbacteria bacterium]